MRRILPLLLLVACSPTEFTFSPTLKGISPKPDNCSIEVMTSSPQRNYQEVGTVAFYNGKEPTTLDAFKKAVQKQACGGGGDAVIAIADNKGHYTQGQVIEWVDTGAPPSNAGSASVPEQQGDTELLK